MGLAADISTLQILPKSITNHSHFRELVYTSRSFDSNEAQEIGLIRYVLKILIRSIHLYLLAVYLILMMMSLMQLYLQQIQLLVKVL